MDEIEYLVRKLTVELEYRPCLVSNSSRSEKRISHEIFLVQRCYVCKQCVAAWFFEVDIGMTVENEKSNTAVPDDNEL